MIPDRGQCEALMAQYGMLANIRDHSIMVARVALLLSDALASAGLKFERQLVVAGALLHDIAKTICLDGSCRHAQHGRDICLEHGMARVADIVAQHVVLDDFAAPLSPVALVYYADKRVRHDEVVSLQERRLYIEERYAQGNLDYLAHIRENFVKCCDLEERIFSHLPFAADSVVARLAAAEEALL
ncbi:MAG: HDIG domain-containing metalloprotein [Thermodesulfobacteriota bacterium]